MKRVLVFLFALFAPAYAWAQCSVPGGGYATVGACPPSINLQLTDVLLGYQYSQSPKTRSVPISQIVTLLGNQFLQIAGGTMTGPLHMGSNLLDGSSISFTGGTISGVNISGSNVTATSSTTARTEADRAADVVNVLDYGVKGDAVQGTFAVTSASTSFVLTVTGASFTSADVGKKLFVGGVGAAGAELATSITAVTDATHITMADAAGSTVTASNQTVTYGTDDAANINAALTAAKARQTIHVWFPPRLYIVASASLNWTLVRNGVIEGYGAKLYGATNGVAILDGIGMFNSRVAGLQFQGDSALPPSTGFQIGRNPGSSSNGLNHVADITLSGYFTKTPYYNLASETTLQEKISSETSSANIYAGIFDGINHWGVTSQYVDMSGLTVDSPLSFTIDNCTSCRFVGLGTNTGALWMAHMKSAEFMSLYAHTTSGKGIVLYQSGTIRVTALNVRGNIEANIGGAPLLYDFYIDGPAAASTEVEGLNFTTNLNVATTAVIYTNAALTLAKVSNANMFMDTIPSAGALFGGATNLQYSGNLNFTNFATSSPTLPSNFVGCVMIDQGSAQCTRTGLIATNTMSLGTTAGASNIYSVVKSAAGNQRGLEMDTGSSVRWRVIANGTAEGGADTGSDFQISRYNDSAVFQGAPLSINRATGATTLAKKTTIGGHIISTDTGPSLSSCGGGSPALTANSTDTVGTFTEGTTSTGCKLTFGTTFVQAPVCVANVVSGGNAITGITTTPNDVTFAHSSGSGGVYNYICVGLGS